MDPTPGVITFADLLTPQGVLIAAAFVLSLVEIVKAGIPAIDSRVSGATMAFVLSGLLYAMTAVAIQQTTLDGYLVVAFAWVACATSAMGLRAGAAHVGEVRNGTAGIRAETKEVIVEDHTDADQSADVPLVEPEVVVPPPVPVEDLEPETPPTG